MTERITQRRQHLTDQLAAIPADGGLLLTTTRDELAAMHQRRALLERQLANLNAAAAAVTSLGSAADDERWRDHLRAWRDTLCAARLEIKHPIRDPRIMGVERNLALSIKCIDRGLRVLEGSGYDLATLRLGELMREAGFMPHDADPARHYAGVMPWHGSLDEVEERIATLAAKRQQAEAQLADALLSDDERAEREAEAARRRQALNSLVIKLGQDGVPVAYRNRAAFLDGEVYRVEDMTPHEREAFTAMQAAWR